MEKGKIKRTVFVSFAPGDEALAEEFIDYMKKPDIVETLFHSRHFFWYRSDDDVTATDLRIADSSAVVLLYTGNTNSAPRVFGDIMKSRELRKTVFAWFSDDSVPAPELSYCVNPDDRIPHTTFLSREEIFNHLADRIWCTALDAAENN